MKCKCSGTTGEIGSRRPRATAKARCAHADLLRGIEQIALSHDAIADTYWDRSHAYDADTRPMSHMHQSVTALASAALVVGFRGDATVWHAP
jgi:hypothetical protein